jgi:Gpi18-like mannosyltransferase
MEKRAGMRMVYQFIQGHQFLFPCGMWLLSRMVITLAMVGIAPLLSAPPGGIEAEIGWGLFSAWDSHHYQEIIEQGYSFTDELDPKLAFFPLLPLLIKVLMLMGLSFAAAGTLISNIAFLGALILLYRWISQSQDPVTARWATLVLAWCPFSLFGSVIYTEGLFLALSLAALYCFEQKNYLWAGVWGSLATATRITGLALVITFFWTAWREKRGLTAYLASGASSFGLIAYSIYCGLRFNHPFAYLVVQRQFWQPPQAFWGQGWIKMMAQLAIGHQNWKHLALNLAFVDPWHPLAFCIICGLAYGLWRYGRYSNSLQLNSLQPNSWQLNSWQLWGGRYFVILVLWLLGGDAFINLAMVLGGFYLALIYRHQIGAMAWFYTLVNFGIIFSSGRTVSAERYVYGIATLAMAGGYFFQDHPRWGYFSLGFFAILLIIFSIRFAQHLWVA